jgi:putative peptidoglycan lipid II flippase
VQLAVQVPALLRLGLLPRPRWGWKHSGVRRILRLMIPTLLGSSAAQINILFDSMIATFLATGSVSWLYYSDRLLEFPLGVFGIALATVILPNLSRKHAENSREAFSATMDWALRLSLVVTIPAAAGLVVLSTPILVTLFQYQAFRPDDVQMASLSLKAYAIGLPAFIAVKVLAPGFYARQDTRTPVKIAVVAMVSNMVLNLAFVASLLAIGFRGPHTGLALASSVAAYINAGLLFRSLRQQGVYQPESGWARVLLAVTVGGAAMAAVLLWQAGDRGEWAQADAVSRGLRLVWLVALGSAAYAVATLGGGLRLHHLEKGSS